MDPRIEAVLEDWRLRGCDPGYAGLHQLADDGFSGAVTADGARGFMVNGRLIVIDGGTIESFWGSDVSAAEADDPAVPLLCAMWLSEQASEAEYYTGETPIDEVNAKLSQGNFTGFIELSENIFSGDYFIVYYGGTSFPVAFIGTDDQLVTGDEAFERAADEVGIFEVKSVDIDVIDIPDPEVDDSTPTAPTEPADAETTDEGDASAADPEPDTPPEAVATSSTDAGTSSEPASPQQTEETTSSEASASTEQSPQPAASDAGVSQERDLASLAAAAEEAESNGQQSWSGNGELDSSVTDAELRVIPSLDPGRTTHPGGQEEPSPASAEPESQAAPERSPATPTSDQSAEAGTGVAKTQPATDDRVRELESELAETREAKKELAAENERLTERVADLEAEVEELEATLAEVQEGPGDDLSPAEAIAGTNLFVRYDSKADLTLEDVIEGGGSPDRVDGNLQLEWHTEFDTTDVRIDEQPFAAFLQGTAEYRFATWLVTQLLFELRETGGDKGLVDLYEAIPQIDRIEFDGEIPIQTGGDGERGSSVYGFDVVCRNSMGDPLLVADLNTSREPVDGDAVSELITNAHEVATGRSTVVGAIHVTNSFYEPDALEAVTSATESGFFRGGSKKSYVRVSRKQGFHLCLVESRDESFHLAVPEL